MRELIQCKALVRKILEADPMSRNSDRRLILKVLESQGYHVYEMYGKQFLPVEAIWNGLSTETIRRVRQAIQNKEGQFLPTDPDVCKKRRIKQNMFYNHFSKQEGLIVA